MWLCQETGWGWLRKVGVSATAGETRLRLRRGYEEPTSKVRRGDLSRTGLSVSMLGGRWLVARVLLQTGGTRCAR